MPYTHNARQSADEVNIGNSRRQADRSPQNARSYISNSFTLIGRGVWEALLSRTTATPPPDCPRRRHITTADSPLSLRSSTAAMSTPRTISALVRARPTSATAFLARSAFRPATTAAAFSTTSRTSASGVGAPPANFRPARPLRFDEKKDSLFDHAGNYFLLTEMFRGMYVVLEQFFRPPYVHTPPGANAEPLK